MAKKQNDSATTAVSDNKIIIKLENCYGINKLDYTFDFDDTKSYAIYAPNGTMKTSFAKTLLNFSEGQNPDILKFPGIVPKLSIRDSKGDFINKSDIFVIKSQVNDFNTEKMSTLLVNEEFRKKHLEITKSIEDKKSVLIAKLQEISGIKTTNHNLELVFTKDITGSANIDFFLQALNDLKHRVSTSEKQFIDIPPYDILFNEKTEAMFQTKDFISNLEKYIETYDKLISSSVFFKKGAFNHTNADAISKQLIDNGFFKADHKVSINTRSGVKTISTADELKAAIEEEKAVILNNSELKKSFETFSAKELQKNAATKALATYLEANPNIIEYFKDWQNFKRDIWASFLKGVEVVYNDVIELNEKAQPELKLIREQAEKETCKWEMAVKIFKDRFCVPFEINIDNKVDVMLSGEETVPSLSFKYIDKFTGNTIPIKKEDLYKRLSAGEQRALYILNIIFEIEARKELGTKTLFVFDDIADSFDYKNKYAIIQYLYELDKKYDNSYQIILTHNFDFFRTIVSRLHIKRPYALHQEMSPNKIELKEMPYQRGIFKTWRNELDKDNLKLIASIPFMRNIAEYCGMEDIENKLTALLHINLKNYPETKEITIKDLEVIIKAVLKQGHKNFVLPNEQNKLKNTDKVKDVIYEVADKLAGGSRDTYLLENKIVLAIAIRLKMEEFILKSIDNNENKKLPKCHHTFNLIENYQHYFGDKNKDIFTKVQLITPENIHINAFMYEPLLDTGYESLVRLYNDVKQLKQ